MAATAECARLAGPVETVESGISMLGLVGAEQQQPPAWFEAASIPALQAIGERALAETKVIFEQHMVQVREGKTTNVPIDVDPLTAGIEAVEMRKKYGRDSPQYREKRAGLRTNSGRFLDETSGKYGPAYFPPLEHLYEAAVDDYVAFDTPMSEITRNGITPLAESYEVSRRGLEHVETMINRGIGQMVMKLSGVHLEDVDSWSQEPIPAIALPAELRLAESVSSVVISELPLAVKQRYLADKAKGIQRAYAGYCPQDDKFMIRSTRFSNDGTSRGVEQIALPGRYITHEVIQRFWVVQEVLSQEQASVVGQDESHGVVMLAAEDMSVLEIVKNLDGIASEMSGENIFLGEVVPADHPKDYDAIPAEAAAKHRQLEDAAEVLSDYVEQMVEDGVDRFVANGIYEVKAKELMFAAVKHDIKLVGQTFGEDTAKMVQASITLRAQGDHMAAMAMEKSAEAKAPPLEACGAGSCGIEGVNTSSEAGKKLAEALNASAGDKVVKDNVRRCKCGSKSVAYAYSAKKVNKFCQSCKSFESKQTVVATS